MSDTNSLSVSDHTIDDTTHSVMVKTTGRSDVGDLFIKSGIFNGQKLVHHPFLVYTIRSQANPDDSNDVQHIVQVNIAKTPQEMLAFADDCEVMVQWPGQYRSDFFHFKVGDYRKFIQSNDGDDF